MLNTMAMISIPTGLDMIIRSVNRCGHIRHGRTRW